MSQELEITTMSEKGQIVIPHAIRKEMDLRTRTKFVITYIDNTIVMKTLQVPDIKKEWSGIFKKIDSRKMKISDRQVKHEIKKYRKSKHK